MILSLRRVRMYAAFYPKHRYTGKMLTGRAYIAGQKSKQVKSAKNLTDDRNGFTESRFSEQQSRYAETREIVRFRVKSHGAEKSIGVTCEQAFITAILSGFDGNGIVHDTAKRMRRMACWLRFFII